jgi:hypothetical protein
LVKGGHVVAGTKRSAEKAALVRSLGARPVVVDVFDRDALRVAVLAERPVAIIHQLTDLGVFDLAANARRADSARSRWQQSRRARRFKREGPPIARLAAAVFQLARSLSNGAGVR